MLSKPLLICNIRLLASIKSLIYYKNFRSFIIFHYLQTLNYQVTIKVSICLYYQIIYSQWIIKFLTYCIKILKYKNIKFLYYQIIVEELCHSYYFDIIQIYYIILVLTLLLSCLNFSLIIYVYTHYWATFLIDKSIICQQAEKKYLFYIIQKTLQLGFYF